MNESSKETQDNKPQIIDEIKQVAKMNPNGWVYKLDAKYDKDKQGYIPSEGIIGWWKVNACGEIASHFIPNPKYKPLNKKRKENE